MMNFHSADRELIGNTAYSEADDAYTRIGEMARDFGVTLRALRFYEDKGLLRPRRQGNARLYTESDKTRLKLVLLGRRVGFSLRDVKQMMDLYEPGGSNLRQFKVALEKSERQVRKLRKQRTALDEAIAELEGAIGTIRDKIAARQTASA